MTAAHIDTPEEAETPKKGGFLHELLDIGKTIFWALLIALVLRVLLFQPFTIPSASMEPTLLEGDYIIVSKFAYGYSRHSMPFSPPVVEGRVFERKPKRGDIIVFKLPRDGRTDYIKRLIGMPGDRIQMRQGQVLVNGRALKRQPLSPTVEEGAFDSVPVQRFRETNPEGRTYVTKDYGPRAADDTGVYVVPQGCYLMMGDNRDNSVDSRFPPVYPDQIGGQTCGWNFDSGRFDASEIGVGFVPAENLVGRADLILFSWYPGASLFKPWTWFTQVRPSRFFTPLG